MKSSPNTIIYDIGANVGDNIPYYLMKSTKVVAVEANPRLVSIIESRFQDEIKNGRLVVENCAVVPAGTSEDCIPFYIHRKHHVWSTAVKPSSQINDFEKIDIPCKTISDIVHAHGPAYYIKIDIEGSDLHVLRDLFRSRIYPPYISVEAHIIDVFCVLVDSGKYNAFKLVEGQTVRDDYQNAFIYSVSYSSYLPYSFPADSAGPFGDDIREDMDGRKSILS
jgi:FkbM family methyltransferase